MPIPFHLLFLFALAARPALGRDVAVRLYANQAHSQLTLTRGAGPSTTIRVGSPVLRVTGPWRVRAPGQQDEIALSYPLEIRGERDRLTMTATLPLEVYVAAVLAGESATFRSDRALAAMAVAARTYAVRFQDRHKSEGYGLCDTTHCQDLRTGAFSERLRQAAEATEGELLWFEGAPAATYYSKDCGGSTEAASRIWPDMKAPYLKVQQDPHCRAQPWSAAIRKEDLHRALADFGVRVPPRLDSLKIVARTPSGRVARLQADGLFIGGSSLRFAVGRALGWNRIRGDLYNLAESGGRFIFEGRGSGHGAGLCQAGAARMGEGGSTYRQILEFYYPGAVLGVSAQGFTWRSLGGERVEVITAKPGKDHLLVALADRMARDAEQRSGLSWGQSLKLRVYPSVAAFRDATGEPGWVAASTRGRTIRLQPVATLRARGSLESTLRHEVLHALIESRARPGLPLWFREGIVHFLAASQKSNVESQKAKAIPPEDGAFLRGRDEARRAHASALDSVHDLVNRFGEPAVLSWIERGLPPNL